jgi:heme-degrading monooxygenase HmoA
VRRTRLTAGPQPGVGGAGVVVSLTEFRARRARDLPAIARDGLALARGWWALEGAIGVVLYADVRTRSGGSLSLWRDEEALRRFVALPRHVAIMRRHRDRVTVRAATWTADAGTVDLDATLAARAARLAT